MYFNCYLGQMFISDVSDFEFVGKVKPAFFYCKRGSIKIITTTTVLVLCTIQCVYLGVRTPS